MSARPLAMHRPCGVVPSKQRALPADGERERPRCTGTPPACPNLDDPGERPTLRVAVLQEANMVRALHFDCFSGISGDMTLGALLDAGADLDAVRHGLDSLGLPIRLVVERVRKGGFAATQVYVQA